MNTIQFATLLIANKLLNAWQIIQTNQWEFWSLVLIIWHLSKEKGKYKKL